MSDIPAFAPGCFGAVFGFNKTDVVCRHCKFAEQCEPVHIETRAALRQRLGIKTIGDFREEEARRKAEKPAVDPAALTLPIKTRQLLERLDKGNYDVVGHLLRGENPFGAAMPFMKLACHLLLRLPRVNQNMIAAAYEKRFEWQRSTAIAHARMAMLALIHIGAVDHSDGLISVRRAG